MRKIAISALLVGVLSSCNNDKKVIKSTPYKTTDSLVASTMDQSNVNIATYSTERVSQLVKPKQNDTVYVTNFWAAWCGPCVREIPHFKETMEELKGKPVKFTFVNLDDKSDWDSEVKPFAAEHGISANTVLLDISTLTGEFFKNNFKTWDGGSIPFTIIQKGDKTDETVGGISKETLMDKINQVSN